MKPRVLIHLDAALGDHLVVDSTDPTNLPFLSLWRINLERGQGSEQKVGQMTQKCWLVRRKHASRSQVPVKAPCCEFR